MASIGDYLNTFLIIQEQAIRSLAVQLVPGFSNQLYIGIWSIVLLYGLEFVIPWRKEQRKLREGVWLDLFYTVFDFLFFFGVIGVAILQTIEIVFHHGLYELFGVQLHYVVELQALPLWSRYALAWLFADLLSYLGHRLLHRSDLLWQLHKVHHSSRQLDVLNAVRLHWGEKVYYHVFMYVPLALVGFGVDSIFWIAFVRVLLSNFTHANLNIPLGPLRYIINNPQLHIWHHAAEIDAKRNVNYGDGLAIWDYLFRTVYLPGEKEKQKSEDIRLGFEGLDEFPTSWLGHQSYPLSGGVRRLFRRLTGHPVGRGHPLRPVAVVCALFVAAGVGIFGPHSKDELRVLLRRGYQPQVVALLAEGQPGKALETLERASGVDDRRLASLERVIELNHMASYRSRALHAVWGKLEADAPLRVATGEAITTRLAQAPRLSDDDRADLARELGNAKLLATLQPDSAEAHRLLGMAFLVRGRDAADRADLASAQQSLQRSLLLDPGNASTRRALDEARRALAG